jgi:hypothetical protein
MQLFFKLFVIFSVVFFGFMWLCVIRDGTIVACNKAMRFKMGMPMIYMKVSLLFPGLNRFISEDQNSMFPQADNAREYPSDLWERSQVVVGSSAE